MKHLTMAQIKKAAKKHKYIILRYPTGYPTATNTGAIPIIERRMGKIPDNQLTNFISWRPCDINEYINHKMPFII